MIHPPTYLVRLSQWTDPVQLVSDPMIKKNPDGSAKISEHFPGRTAYRVGVEVMMGTKSKVMPDGSTLEFPQVETKNVTVWSDGPVQASVGDYVELVEPLIGAVDSTIYVQALGIKKLGDHNE